jgi:hypothetical protein
MHTDELQNLNSHPIISDSVSAFKQNKYGSLTLRYADKSYATFVSPALPYLQTPISYASPYISRADELAATGLDRVDQTFPVVTKDTQTLKDDVFGVVTFPIVKANEAKDHVLSTYSQQYKQCGGDGVLAGGKAVITTGLAFTSQTLTLISQWLAKGQQKGEVKVKEIKEKTQK